MRDVLFIVANSLDNYIARLDGSVDWLLDSEDALQVLTAFFERVDTVVMGRKTYEESIKLGGGSGSFPGMRVIVLSKTLSEPLDEGSEIVPEDAAAFVRKLKAEDGKPICCLGGGEIAKALFEADLIDEIHLNVHPVLLGSGVPLFLPLDRPVDLELTECRAVEGGCVFLTYRVKRPER